MTSLGRARLGLGLEVGLGLRVEQGALILNDVTNTTPTGYMQKLPETELGKHNIYRSHHNNLSVV